MLSRRGLVLGTAAVGLVGWKSWDIARQGNDGLSGVFDTVDWLTMRSQRLLAGDSLAPEFTEADIRQGQRTNGSTNPNSPDYVALRDSGFRDYRLTVTGLVEVPLSISYAELTALPARTQITRHDCVEGWSCIGKWTGVPLGVVLAQARPKVSALYAVFHCYDTLEKTLSGEVKYYESIDMIDAYHPQTILAYGLNDKALPVENGAPLRLRVERQLGYKMAKYVHTIELVDTLADLGGGRGSYWADRGYQWYAGI